MSFLSANFAACLAAGLLAFHLGGARWRPLLLLALSVAFYCTWNPWHLPVLLGATGLVYAAGRLIEGSASQSAQLRLTALAVSGLVLLLIFFKCASALVGALALGPAANRADVIVALAAPLGLSYFLFKLIGYLLDVYWGQLPAQRNFVSLALYASFFPQIVSGPIQRAEDFFEQLTRIDRVDEAAFVTGLRRIAFGLFKKIVVADQLGIAVARIHTGVAEHSALELLVGAYFFSLQMYADFSGITDIALGIGQLFGIKGPENFARPYFARNLQDFWRRWHMSLTSWLTDYLFQPLRISLRELGNTGLALAIFVNMVAVGVWHGPRWTYLVFGCLNGLFMIVSVLTLKQRNAFFRTRPLLSRLRVVAGPLITFHLVVATHVFFQAPDLGSALGYFAHMLPGPGHPAAASFHLSVFGVPPVRLAEALAGLCIVEAVNWATITPRWVARFSATPRPVRWALYYALVLVVIFTAKGTASFIYAKF